jgi:hypothetical protein
VGVQDANRVGAQDAWYPAVGILYTQHSLTDTKLASCEKKGTFSWAVFLLNKIKPLKNHRDERADQKI